MTHNKCFIPQNEMAFRYLNGDQGFVWQSGNTDRELPHTATYIMLSWLYLDANLQHSLQKWMQCNTPEFILLQWETPDYSLNSLIGTILWTFCHVLDTPDYALSWHIYVIKVHAFFFFFLPYFSVAILWGYWYCNQCTVDINGKRVNWKTVMKTLVGDVH